MQPIPLLSATRCRLWGLFQSQCAAGVTARNNSLTKTGCSSMSWWLSLESVSVLFTCYPTVVRMLWLALEIVSVSVCGDNRTLPLPVPVITYTSALLFPPLCLTLILCSRLPCQPRNPSGSQLYSRHSLSSPWPFINCIPLAHWMPTLLDVLAVCLCLSCIFSHHNCFWSSCHCSDDTALLKRQPVAMEVPFIIAVSIQYTIEMYCPNSICLDQYVIFAKYGVLIVSFIK